MHHLKISKLESRSKALKRDLRASSLNVLPNAASPKKKVNEKCKSRKIFIIKTILIEIQLASLIQRQPQI